jgi:hypothetical protein
MADFYSEQITKSDQTTPAVFLDPTDLGGRERVARFDFKTPASSAPAVGENIYLARLPAGARVLAIYANWEAMSSAAGTAGADFGDAGDDDRFITALNMDAAGSGFQALRLDATATPALGYGYKYAAATLVKAKVTGEAWAVSKYLRGHVVYVVD